MFMQSKRLGRQTVTFSRPPVILSESSVVGKKEGEGPLGDRFDVVEPDAYFGQRTWEAGESAMLRRCLSQLLARGGTEARALDFVLSGDLQNQCAGSAYAMRGVPAPYLGLYGACSTLAEALSLAAMLIDGGFAARCAAVTGSHFCTAERQYRFPLEYGGQRPPSAQWTVTGAGAAVLGLAGDGPRITRACPGKIVDYGVTDANNMGAAMAPAMVKDTQCHEGRAVGPAPAADSAILSRIPARSPAPRPHTRRGPGNSSPRGWPRAR